MPRKPTMSLETAIAELTVRAPALAADCVVNREAVIRQILHDHIGNNHPMDEVIRSMQHELQCQRERFKKDYAQD